MWVMAGQKAGQVLLTVGTIAKKMSLVSTAEAKQACFAL